MKNYWLLLIYLLLPTLALSQNNTAAPFVLGSIRTVHSTILSEDRILNIYLPEGYKEEDSIHYPVIYLLDGGKEEDFIHVTGLIQFYNFEWIDRVPKSIVVGIANTDRKKDFTFPSTVPDEQRAYPTTGGSASFIAFIEKELKPFINKNFKTTQDAMLIGQSLGGLLATEIVLKKPGLFNRYLLISPSLWWSDGVLLKEKNQPVTQRTQVYIAVGKEGLTPGKNPRIMEVDAHLLAEKLKELKNSNLQVTMDYLPAEDHATIGHQAVMNGLKALYPKR